MTCLQIRAPDFRDPMGQPEVLLPQLQGVYQSYHPSPSPSINSERGYAEAEVYWDLPYNLGVGASADLFWASSFFKMTRELAMPVPPVVRPHTTQLLGLVHHLHPPAGYFSFTTDLILAALHVVWSFSLRLRCRRSTSVRPARSH